LGRCCLEQVLEKIKVLIVDDEVDFADILAKRLEVRGFEVATIFNGDDAIRCIKGQEFDVVLLDVLMPGKSGIDTLKEIKKIRPLVHIIMLTGHARVDTAMEGMELGAYDYLIKPTETEALVEKIRLAHSHKTSQEERIRQTRTAPPPEKRGWKKIFSPVSDLFQKDRTGKTDGEEDA
jgi:DNA-binding NtrC family response regulator